jgi:cytochrome P450
MYKQAFSLQAQMNDGGTSAPSNFPSTPVSQQPRSRSDSWFEAMAQAWAKVMDKQAEEVVSLSSELSNGQDDPSTAVQLQAQAQKMAFLSTGASTSINTLGNALEVLAKKQ